MVLRLADHLDVPLRERNTLLLAAGHAPAYSRHDLTAPPMAAVHEAIERILAAHHPYPALVVDRRWDMVAGNDAVTALTADVAAHLLDPPVNVLRLSLHPDGLAPRIVNLGEWGAHLRSRLAHEVRATGDPDLAALLDELETYPAGEAATASDALVAPLRLRVPGGELSMISTTTVFGTPRDVTVSELAIESFYPADDATARALRDVARSRATASR